MAGKREVIYQSKKPEDWEKAQSLLKEAGIAHHAWTAEEAPAGGCGSKIDPRKFLRKVAIPKLICRIEVAAEDREKAQNVLNGQVLPFIHYGLS